MSIGKFLKNATRVRFDSHTLGNLARNAGNVAGTLIGGPAGAAIAGGVSALRTAARPGANIGDILKSGAGDAATAYGLNKGATALSSLLGGSPAGAAAGSAGALPPDVVGPDVPIDGPIPSAEGSSGGLGSILSKAPQALSSFLPHSPDGSINFGSIFDKGLGAAQLVNAANLQKQSTGYAKDAYKTATQSYADRAPLRALGIAGLQNPQTPDLSSLNQIQGNPFTVKKPAPTPVSAYG